MALLAVSLLALAEMTVYVYKKDGTKVAYVASTVDSIGFVDVNNFADGHEWVDLGLPSGTKWATMNVGANSPENYRVYFAWGETTPKSEYSNLNYSYSGTPTTLPLDRDAAYINWGSSWRMPTRAEFEELIANCTWIWTTQNGVSGHIVTGPNGYSIFLPAAGYRRDTGLSRAGSYGYYRSSSLPVDYSYRDDRADYLYFESGNVYVTFFDSYRYCGLSVRPVLREIYTLVFDANGGSGSMSAVELNKNESKNIPANTFTRDGYRFICWNTKADGSGTAYTDQSTITPTANMTLYAQWLNKTSMYVDLGLPSGTKWATMNVGAISPEDYGDYFAWGETTTKSSYTESNYSDFSSYPAILPLGRDAANAKWGSGWRMPTEAEQYELRNTSYTTWTWTTQNGVNGYKVTSKANGNSIFLPAAGYRSGSDLYSAGSSGDYWSSSLNTNSSYYHACSLFFNSSNVSISSGSRYYGRSVRPVMAE